MRLMLVSALLVFALLPRARSQTYATDVNQSARMTRRVDELLKSYWDEHELAPSTKSSDSEFMRRVYLDLVGTIPTASEAQQFLDDPDEAKRHALIDQLLQSPRHPTHLANTWRRILIADQTTTNLIGQVGMQEWLRHQFVENTRFDRFVGNFLTVSGEQDAGPVIYYRLLELKPEKLASSVARCFLGVQLQCAECHDHPFVDTSQQDFWSFAAFFARVRNRYGEQMSPYGRFSLYDTPSGEVTLPDDDEPIAPRYPDTDSSVESRGTRREQLSLWIASPDNRYLGPATVNRVWSLLFGRGLVHPVDDMGPHNPSDHPELLDELTSHFVAGGYDLRDLIRVLANTRAYQLSSKQANDQKIPAASFARMHIKTLTADQLYDSLRATLRMPRRQPTANPLLEPTRQLFVAQMKSQSPELTKLESSVQQTLMMMNGQITEQFINGQQRGVTAALAAPYLSEEERLDLLFLSSLTRKPTASERDAFAAHLSTFDDEQSKQGIADILWAIVNSSEYRLNH